MEAQEGAQPSQSQNVMQGPALSKSDPKTSLWVSWALSQLGRGPQFSQCKVQHPSPASRRTGGFPPLPAPTPLQRSCNFQWAPGLQVLNSWSFQKIQ